METRDGSVLQCVSERGWYVTNECSEDRYFKCLTIASVKRTKICNNFDKDREKERLCKIVKKSCKPLASGK